MSSIDPILIPAPEAARRLSICVKTLQTRTREGLIPCVRIGRRVLYCPQKLLEWVANQTASLGGNA